MLAGRSKPPTPPAGKRVQARKDLERDLVEDSDREDVAERLAEVTARTITDPRLWTGETSRGQARPGEHLYNRRFQDLLGRLP